MATVPEADIPTAQAEPLPGRAYPRFSDDVSPAEMGAGIGSALERTGVRGAEQQKQEQKTAAEKAQREADQVRVTQAYTALSTYTTDALYGPIDPKTGQRDASQAAYGQQGDAAVGLSDRFMPGFDQKAQELSESLGNDAQRATFAGHIAQQRDEMNLGLARYENEAFGRTRAQADDAAAKQTVNAIGLNWRGMSDLKSYQDAKSNLVAIGERVARNKGLDRKDTVSGLTDAAIGTVVETALAEGGAKGVGFASRFLDEHKEELTNPALNPSLRDKIDAKQKQLDADLKDGLKEKFDSAVQGVRAGIPGSANLISNGELQILDKHNWQEKRHYLEAMTEAGASKVKYDQLGPAQIQDDLTKSDPRNQPAHVGQEAEIEAYNFKVAAAERSIAERKADPRAFAIKQYGDQPIDWTQDTRKATDTIGQRAATAADDSRRLGVNMPLLSKNEAAQLSYTLDQAPPDRQAQILSQFREGLRDERTFSAIIDQIRPNSPVIAEAGMRVPKNPATAPLWYNANYDNAPNVAQDILAGNALIAASGDMKAEEGKGPKGFKMPPDNDLRVSFNDKFKNAPFFGNPLAADQTYAAWRAIYAKEASRLGVTNGLVSSDAAKYANKALLPNMDDHFAGRSVPVPAGMDPAQFPDRVREALDANLKSRGLDMKLFKGHALVQEGRMGSGDYAVLDSTGHNVAVYPGTNTPVRIHLNEQYRRPDSPIRPAYPSKREFPTRNGSQAPNFDTETPETPLDRTVPADFEAAER